MAITKSARRSIARCENGGVADSRVRYGNRLIIAGSNVIEYSHAAAMPMAVMFPRCQYGGESEKFNARKPTIVVSDVMDTGRKFTRTASIRASCLPSPSRMKPRRDSRM